MQSENFTSGVLTFADDSTVTVVAQSSVVPAPVVQPTDTEITITLSDGSTKVFVPQA